MPDKLERCPVCSTAMPDTSIGPYCPKKDCPVSDDALLWTQDAGGNWIKRSPKIVSSTLSAPSTERRHTPQPADEITRLKGEVERLTEALTDLRQWATVLHQNSVGCAQNHHGDDLERFGMPGWLDDAGASISRATNILARSAGKAGSDA